VSRIVSRDHVLEKDHPDDGSELFIVVSVLTFSDTVALLIVSPVQSFVLATNPSTSAYLCAISRPSCVNNRKQ